MKNGNRCVLFVLGTVIIVGTAILSLAQAQENTYRLAYTDIFGPLRRPAVDFAHEAHELALEEKGCGVCHHAPEEETGRLIYLEGEETGCSECHGSETEDSTPALREAFHGSCNRCHRQMGRSIKNFKGPTTCGECHIPQSSSNGGKGS